MVMIESVFEVQFQQLFNFHTSIPYRNTLNYIGIGTHYHPLRRYMSKILPQYKKICMLKQEMKNQ